VGNSGKREAAGTRGFSMKKEAVGNSGAREAARTMGSSVKKGVGNSGEREAAWTRGTRRSQWKKRLWEILGKKRLREHVVPSEKRSCGKFWGKRGCGNKRFPVKKEAVENSGEREAAGTRGSL
jgi:hypothetical protein